MARAGSDTNFPRAEHSVFSGRPVTESAMSRAGSDINFPRDEHSEFFGRLVTQSVTAQAESDTDFSQWGIFRTCRPTGHEVGGSRGR